MYSIIYLDASGTQRALKLAKSIPTESRLISAKLNRNKRENKASERHNFEYFKIPWKRTQTIKQFLLEDGQNVSFFIFFLISFLLFVCLFRSFHRFYCCCLLIISCKTSVLKNAFMHENRQPSGQRLVSNGYIKPVKNPGLAKNPERMSQRMLSDDRDGGMITWADWGCGTAVPIWPGCRASAPEPSTAPSGCCTAATGTTSRSCSSTPRARNLSGVSRKLN